MPPATRQQRQGDGRRRCRVDVQSPELARLTGRKAGSTRSVAATSLALAPAASTSPFAAPASLASAPPPLPAPLAEPPLPELPRDSPWLEPLRVRGLAGALASLRAGASLGVLAASGRSFPGLPPTRRAPDQWRAQRARRRQPSRRAALGSAGSPRQHRTFRPTSPFPARDRFAASKSWAPPPML